MTVGRSLAEVGVTVSLRTLTCETCGMDWQRPRVRGQQPRRCPPCAANHGQLKAKRLDTNTAGYRLTLAVTNYRLAIEEATAALLLGKNAEALEALRRVQAPTRTAVPRPRQQTRVIDLTTRETA